MNRWGEADDTGGFLCAAKADGTAHVGEGGRPAVAEGLFQGQSLVVELLEGAGLGVVLPVPLRARYRNDHSEHR